MVVIDSKVVNIDWDVRVVLLSGSYSKTALMLCRKKERWTDRSICQLFRMEVTTT